MLDELGFWNKRTERAELVGVRGVISCMWWRNTEPMTDQERLQEISRLENIRDRLLARAPKHFYFLRFLLPFMLLMMLGTIAQVTTKHPIHPTIGSVLFLAVFVVVLLWSTWRVWAKTPDPGNLWEFSDRIGYEGDSPRDIQKKIDALRSQSDEQPPARD